jgi:GNAT superfamily N-acetyltransferase
MIQTEAKDNQHIDPNSLREHPEQLAVTLDYHGAPVMFRLVTANDARILGDYFLSLSEDTKRRYGPHPFDRATAEHLCATTDPAQTLRMIATTSSGPDEQVIAYFILVLGIHDFDAEHYAKLNLPLNAETDCTLAPSVSDAHQSHGLGSILMRQLKVIARQVGRKRMVLWGGTQGTNERAIHFYHKHGFVTVGTFDQPPGFLNYDMIMDL